LSSLGNPPGYIEFEKTKQPKNPRNETSHGFHALRDLHFQWNDLAQMHRPEDGEAKKK